METILIGFGVGLVKYTLWFLLFIFAVAIFKTTKTKIDANYSAESPDSIFEVVYKLKWRYFAFILCLSALAYLSVAEMAYRPKTQPSQQNYELDKQLQKVDEAEIVIPESETDKQPTWEEVRAKSKAENDAAKAEFNKLKKAKPEDNEQ